MVSSSKYATLLTGVSSITLLLSQNAQAADPVLPVIIEAPVCNVSQPWVGAFGATDFENGGGGAEFFLPFMAECDRVLFGFGRGVGLVDGIVGGDVGIGYRFLSDPDTGFGLNVSGGYWESDEGTDAWRGTVGLEAFTGRFDAHVNLHISDTDDETVVTADTVLNPGEGRIWVEDFGHDIFMDTDISGSEYERAMSGIEGEIGFRPITAGGPNLSQLDLRIYGTGFYYWADNSDNISTGVTGAALPDVDYDDRYGGGIGGEARFAFDAANPGSHLFVNAKGEYDNQEDWTGFLRAGVRIALGSSSGSPFSAIEQRLMDPVERANMMFNTRTIDPFTLSERVYSPYGGQREIIGGVYFAATNPDEGADGAEGRPTDVDDAVARAQADTSPEGDGRIIVLQDNDNLESDDNPFETGSGLDTDGIVLEDHTIVMGADSSVDLTGAQSGNTGTYYPTNDPLVEHNGTWTTIRANEGVGTVVTTGKYNQFLGFRVDGQNYANIGFYGEGVSYNRFFYNEVFRLGENVNVLPEEFEFAADISQLAASEPGLGELEEDAILAESFAAGIFYENSNNIDIDNVNVGQVISQAGARGFDGLDDEGEGGLGGDAQSASGRSESYGFRFVDTTDITISDSLVFNIQSRASGNGGIGGDGGAGGMGGSGGTGAMDARAAGVSIVYTDEFSGSEANIAIDGFTARGISSNGGTSGGAGGQIGGHGGSGIVTSVSSGLEIRNSLENHHLTNVSVSNVSASSITGGGGTSGGTGQAGGALSNGGHGGSASVRAEANGIVVENFSNVSLEEISLLNINSGGSPNGGSGGDAGNIPIVPDFVQDGLLFGGDGGSNTTIYEINGVKVTDSDNVQIRSVSADSSNASGGGNGGNGGDGAEFRPESNGNGGQGGSSHMETDFSAVKVERSQSVEIDYVRAENFDSSAAPRAGQGGAGGLLALDVPRGNGGKGGNAHTIERVSAVNLIDSDNVTVRNVDANNFDAGNANTTRGGDGGDAFIGNNVIQVDSGLSSTNQGALSAIEDDLPTPNSETGGRGGDVTVDVVASAVTVNNSTNVEIYDVFASNMVAAGRAGDSSSSGYRADGGSGTLPGRGGNMTVLARASGVNIINGSSDVVVNEVVAVGFVAASVGVSGRGGTGLVGGSGGHVEVNDLASAVAVEDSSSVQISDVTARNFNVIDSEQDPASIFGKSIARAGFGGSSRNLEGQLAGPGGDASATSHANAVHVSFSDAVAIQDVSATELNATAIAEGGSGTQGGIGGNGGNANADARSMAVEIASSTNVGVDQVFADQLASNASATGGDGGSSPLVVGNGGNGGGAQADGDPVTARAISAAVGVSGASSGIALSNIIGFEGQDFSAVADATGGNGGTGIADGEAGSSLAIARAFGVIGFDGLAAGEVDVSGNNVNTSIWSAIANAAAGTGSGTPDADEDADFGVTELPL